MKLNRLFSILLENNDAHMREWAIKVLQHHRQNGRLPEEWYKSWFIDWVINGIREGNKEAIKYFATIMKEIDDKASIKSVYRWLDEIDPEPEQPLDERKYSELATDLVRRYMYALTRHPYELTYNDLSNMISNLSYGSPAYIRKLIEILNKLGDYDNAGKMKDWYELKVSQLSGQAPVAV